MVQIFCKLCLNSVPVADWKSHVTQKQHLQQLPCKIIVKGSFKKDQVDEVYKYFEKFGGIRGQNVTFVNDETVIEYRFWDARVYSTVIHQEHVLFEQELAISWYKKVKSGPLQHVIPDQKMQNEKFVYRKLAIINDLKELETFTDQLKYFQNKLENIHSEASRNRQIIREDLTTALAPNFRDTQIQFFGSSITDLDIHNSDLNVYINNTDSEVSTLELIKDLISKSENFTDACLNSQQEVTFHHQKTKILCNLNIKNELPVGNSELIKFYLTLDEKLRLFILVIKFWADCNELKGENCLSSYATYAMAIFFLQQEPYKLPSVVELQRDLPPDEIDNWNCAFGPVEYQNYHLENATILDLVEGFFKFYSDADYISQVISLYFGSMIDKTRFISPPDLPECFEDYLNQDEILSVNEGFCIQDFFELSKNVSTISLSCSGRFVALCRNSLQLIVSEEKKLLSKLFGQDSGVDEFYLMNVDEQIIRKRVTKVLKEVFGCEVKETMSDEGVVYHCKGERNVWDNRIRIMKNCVLKNFPDISKEKKEIVVTSHIMKNSTENVIWKMVVVLKFETDQRAKVVLREEENLSVILHFQHFLYLRLRDSFAEEEAENDIGKEVKNEIKNEVEVEDQGIHSTENAKKGSVNGDLKEGEIKSENNEIITISDATNLCEESVIFKENVCAISEKLEEDVHEAMVTEEIPSANLDVMKPCEENESKSSFAEETIQENMFEINLDVKKSEGNLIDGENSSNAIIIEEISSSDELETMKLCEENNVDKEDFCMTNEKFEENENNTMKGETVDEDSSVVNLDVEISENMIDERLYNTIIEEIPASDNADFITPCEENDTNKENLRIIKENCEENSAMIVEEVIDKNASEMNLHENEINESLSNAVEKFPTSENETELKNSWAIPSERETDENSKAGSGIVASADIIQNEISPVTKVEIEKTPYDVPAEDLEDDEDAVSSQFDALKFFISNKVKEIPTFSAQLDVLIGELKLVVAENSRKSQIVRNDLSQILLSAVPEIRLDFIGSSTVGLCLNNTLKIGVDAGLSESSIKDVILRCDKFDVVVDEERDKKTEITFKHAETRTLCDLDLRSEAAVISNDMLRYYVGLDEKVRDLMLVVKFWTMSYRHLPKSPYLPGYVLYIFVIFYLQQEPYNLPSVEELLKNTPVNKSPPFENATLAELVEGFFQFYEKFDQLYYVVSPYFGRLTPKFHFPEFEDSDICLCVQDFLDPDKNIAFRTCTGLKFTIFCKNSVEFINSGETELLYYLLNYVTDSSVVDFYTFFIAKNDERSDDEWIKNVKDLIWKIFTEIFVFDVNEVSSSCDEFHLELFGRCNPFRDRMKAWQDLDGRFEPGLSEFEKEVAVTKYVVSDTREEKFVSKNFASVAFVKDPCRVRISFRRRFTRRSLLCMHYEHFLRANLEKFLAEPIDKIDENSAELMEVEESSLDSKTSENDTGIFSEGKICHEKILSKVGKGNNFTQEIKILHKILKASDEIYEIITNDVNSALEKFPDHRIQLSGSRVTNLAFQNSNVNIYVDLTQNIDPDLTLSFTFKTALIESKKFSDFDFISDSVKCKHISTQMSCDININKNSVARTDLIKNYTNLDERVLLLMMMVKYWSKRFENDQTTCFSSYSFHLMVIFYLQQEYEFPPVPDLEKDSSFSSKFENATCRGLTVDFFKFYGNFDYTTYVISPFSGRPFDKTYADFDGTEMSAGICIQDPIGQKSIIFSSDLDLCGKFAASCRIASKMICLHEMLKVIDPICQTLHLEKIDAQSEQTWISSVTTHATHILTKILGYKLCDVDIDRKRAKFRVFQKSDVWTARVNVSRMFRELEGIDRDVAATEYIAGKYSIKGQKSSFVVDLVCKNLQLSNVTNPYHVLHVFHTRLIQLLRNPKIPNIIPKDFQHLKNLVSDKIKEGPFENQMSSFMKTLEDDRQTFEARCSLVHQELKERFTDVTVFGSTISGLHMSSSTLDVHLESRQDFHSDDKFVICDGASSPIVCRHVKTGLDVKISWNKLYVFNSELVRYYVNLDEKIRRLFIFVRFWAACYAMERAFSNYYVFDLMTIFFLQCKYGLPPVSLLQEKTPGVTVDGWDCGFAHLEFKNPVLEEKTMLDLITDFFTFYARFDYFTYVISPYFGFPIEKSAFIKPCTSPIAFEMEVSPSLCIQDVFELNRNVVASISDLAPGQFTALCRKALTCIERGEKLLLSQLFVPSHFYHGINFNDDELKSFTIGKKTSLNDSKWGRLFKDVLVKILKDLWCCDVKESGDCLECSGNIGSFRRNSMEFLKKLSRDLPPGADNWVREKTVATSSFSDVDNVRLSVTVSLKKFPTRMYVEVSSKKNFFLFHHLHFLYTRLLKFLPGEGDSSEEGATDQSQLSNDSNEDGAGEVAIFVKSTSKDCVQVEHQQKAIIADLSSLLKPVFPRLEVCFYDNGINLPQGESKIFLNGVGDLELMRDLMSKGDKFQELWLEPDDEFFTGCTHVNTHVSCHVSVKTKLPVYTNELIRFYAGLDPKFSLLMKIVTVSSKLAIPKTSIDAVLLMVVFFLQQECELPSVADLQKDCPVDLVDGCNCGYRRDLFPVEDVTFFELLAGFFQFYANFDFASYMICPYFGSPVKKACFLKPFDLPQCYQQYLNRNEEMFVSAEFSIQDPFQHNCNLLENSEINSFPAYCRAVAKFLQNEQSIRVFYQKEKITDYTIVRTGDGDEDRWRETVRGFLLRIFKEVMDCEVEESVQDGICSFYCEGRSNFWKNRIHGEKTILSPEMTEIDREVEITSFCKLRFYLHHLEFNVILTFQENSCTVILKTPKQSHFKNFLRNFIYLKLAKALNDRKEYKIRSEKIQVFKSITEGELTFAERVRMLQEKLLFGQNEFEQSCKIIRSDLGQILNLNKIVFDKFLNFRGGILNIYIKNESDLEQMKDSICKSDNFRDATIIASNFLRCRHRKTKITCEINISDEFSEKTNELIEYYLNLDEKLIALITLTKFWADSHKLTGVYRFSDRELTFMMIFFLQQEPHNLPSVADLLNESPYPEFKNPILEKATILELFKMFLEFYSKFDYFFYAISPFYGSPMEKTRFLKPYDPHEWYKDYINEDKELDDSFICIQDLFEHSKNLSSVSSYLSAHFASICRNSLLSMTGKDESQFMNGLLSCENEYAFTVRRNVSVENLMIFLEKMLHVFYCEVKLESQTENELSYIYTGKYNIWNKRVRCLKKLQVPVNRVLEVDEEIAVTKQVIEDYPQKSSWKFTLLVEFTETEIRFRFLKEKNLSVVVHFCHYIYIKFIENFSKAEKEETDVAGVDGCESCDSNEVDEKNEDVMEIDNGTSCDEIEKRNSLTDEAENPMQVEENPSDKEDAMLVAIKSASTFTEQTTVLRSHLQSGDSVHEKNFKFIVSDFIHSLPFSEVYLFGSRLTGLEVATSDANICVIPHKRAKAVSKELKYIETILNRSGKFTGAVTKKDVGMKLLVVECVHRATRIPCMVYVYDKVVVRNSELIKYYLDLGDNLRTFFLCVHFWAGRHLPGHFSKYALNLMLIFFLQQPPYEVPSVLELQNNTIPETLGEWNYAFSKPRKDSLKATLHELMAGFFKFYGDFDYFSFIISPYYGSAVAKTRFLKPCILPKAYRNYISQKETLDVDSTVVCVQDPFEHAKNVMSTEGAIKFAALCRRAHHLIQQNNTFHDLLLSKSLDQTCEFSVAKDEDQDERNWQDLIKMLISKILTRVFMGSIAATKISSPDSFSYQCHRFVNVWDKRSSVLKTVLKQLHRNTKSIEKEIAVSLHYVNSKTKHEAWTLVVDVVFTKDRVSVSLKENPDVFYFCHFIYSRLVKFLKEEKSCQSSTSAVTSQEGSKASVAEVATVSLTVCQEETIKTVSPTPAATAETNELTVQQPSVKKKMKRIRHRIRNRIWKRKASDEKQEPRKEESASNITPEASVHVEGEEELKTNCSSSENVSSEVGKEETDISGLEENELKVESVQIDSREEQKNIKTSVSEVEDVQTCEKVNILNQEIKTTAEEQTACATSSSAFSFTEEHITVSSATVSATPSTSSPTSSFTLTARSISEIKNKKYKVLKSTMDKLKFVDQVAHFTSNLLVDQVQIESIQKIIYDDLIRILTPHLNFNQINFFGSSLTRLFTEESKFDIYIDNPRKHPGPGPKLAVEEILSKSEEFIEVVLTPDKIIKCKHVLGAQCEIHFNNRLPVCTTLLIHYYLSFDPKLQTLMFLVKSWADFYQLKQQSHLSHYALYLMVIFFLQQPPYNLPPVYTLQNNIDIVEFWNCFFGPIEFKSPALEKATILDLLSDFFTFYSTFDYFSYVIAPFFGSPIDKTCFMSPFNLPECYFYYLRNSKFMYVDCSVCVQDVFEHSTNVARQATLMSLGRFAALCRGALQLLPAGEKHLLHRLMSECQTGNSVDFHGIQIARTRGLDSERWLQTIQSVIFIIITEILCCNIVKVQHKEMNRGRKVVKVGKKFRSGDMDQIIYDCVGQWRIWENRIHILKAWIEKINPMASCMDKDVFVSRCLRSDVGRTGRWDLTVDIILMKNPACVRLMLFGGGSKLYITHFFCTRILSALVRNVAQISAQEKLNSNPLLSAFSEPYKLLIKELPKDKVNQVIEHFSTLGPVIVNQKVIDDKEKVSIEYCFAEAVAYLRFITQEHIVSDEKLRVVPLSLLKEKISNVNFQDFRLSVIYKVTEAPTFNEQMSIFRQEIEPMKEHRQRVLNDLSSMFEAKFFTLDFDVENDLKIFVESESITLEKIKNETEADVKFTKVSLNNSVVKCQHVLTRICCSIRIGDKLMAANSRLLKYYSSLDPKLELSMNAIFFWANSYDLMPDDNFWFSLLIIFYLQQEYKLPSFKDLQENTIPEFIKGWNCSYAALIEYSNPSLESASFFDLVQGFFKFYEHFDYISYLISPYHGEVFEKIAFLDLPEQLRIDINCGLVIQDLFEHSRNVSINVPQDSVGKFTCLCRSALALIEQGQNLLLHRLFLHCMNSSVVDFPGFALMKPLEREQEEWVQSVNRITLKILSDVLSYRLTLIPVFSAQRVSYGCVGGHDVWKDRIEALKTLSAQLKDAKGIEKETAVTTCVIQELSHEGWNVLVDLTFRTEPCGVKVVFTRKSGYFDLFHVCQFVCTRLERFLKDEMKKEVADTNKTEVKNISSSVSLEVRDSYVSRGAADCQKKNTDIASGCVISEPIEKKNQDVTDEDRNIPKKVNENSEVITEEKSKNISSETNEVNTEQGNNNITEQEKEKSEENNKSVIEQKKENTCEEKQEDTASSEIGLVEDSPPNRKRKKSKTTEEGEITDEEEDDDVPSDFFDDFAREDFLDGLDIVDVWDDDSKVSITDKTKEEKKRKKKKSKTPERRRKRTRTRSRDRRRRSASGSSRERWRRRRRSSSGSSREKSRRRRRSPPTYGFKRRRRNLGYRSRRRRSYSRGSRRSDSYSPPPRRGRKTFLEEIRDKLNEMKPTTPPAPVICDLPAYTIAMKGVTSTKFLPSPGACPLTVLSPMELSPLPTVTPMAVSLSPVLPPLPPSLLEAVQPLVVPPVAVLPPIPGVDTPAGAPLFSTTYCSSVFEPLQLYPESSLFENSWMMTSIPPPLPPTDAPDIPPPPMEAPPVPPPPPMETDSRSSVQHAVLTKDDPVKLFAEKRISLSDFLSITAKKEARNSDSEHLQDKTKVLLRCQAVIKILTRGRRPRGRLRVKPAAHPEIKPPLYESPLKRMQMVKFTLTTPPHFPEGETVFSEAINGVLQEVGLAKKVDEEKDDVEDVIDVVFRELGSGNLGGDRHKVVQILKRHLVEESVESAVNDIGAQCVIAKGTCTVDLQVEETELSPRKRMRSSNGRSIKRKF